jgi:uncharacterized phiE125 gp8 family phage protein
MQILDQYLLAPPAAEPVTVAEARVDARLEEGDHWDAILSKKITDARAVAEHQTGRRFMEQTWRVELPDWPSSSDKLRYLRPTSVAVSYWDGTDWVALVDDTDYVWAPVGLGLCLAPVLGGSWPALGEVAVGARVRIDVKLGAVDAADVPPEAVGVHQGADHADGARSVADKR